jgi:hypothetical protein
MADIGVTLRITADARGARAGIHPPGMLAAPVRDPPP